jgi:4-amino-4-deoxy-L-arabinose transferase-like glycosyltransferase
VDQFKQRLGPDQLLLAAAFVTFSCSTIIWTLRDHTPPPWDPADHLAAAYDYAQPIAHADFASFGREFFLEHHYYAPLVHVATGFFYLVLGASRLTGIFVNLLSMAVLMYSVYWMGNRLYGPAGVSDSADSATSRGDSRSAGLIRYQPSAGALAAVLSISYHFPAWLLHDAFLDYPLTAIVAASMALLIKAGDFRTSRAAVWFGTAAGLGMLTKQTFAFFLVLPVLYCATRVLMSRDRRAIRNFALAIGIAAAIAAVWYAPHVKDVIDIYRINQQGAIDENEAPLFSFMSNVFYLHGLVSSQTQLFFGLLLAVGLLYSMIRKRRQTLMLYLWLASGVAAFTLIANKDMRYTIPVLPAAALISVCWVSGSRTLAACQGSNGGGRRSSSIPTITAACSLLVTGWAGVSFFNAQWPGAGSGIYIDTPRFRWMVFARNYFGFDHRPQANDWSVPEIIQTTIAQAAQVPSDNSGPSAIVRPVGDAPHNQAQHGPDNSVRPTLGVIVNLPYLNPSSISLYARLLAARHWALPPVNVDWLVNDSAKPRLTTCDYILVRTGLAEADWVSPMERYAEQEMRSHPDSFVRVASFPIPLPNAEAVIYKCIR